MITYDIPGALPGTKRTKGVKNFEQAYRLRTENPPVQRQNNHYQYFPNQFRNKEHRNSDAHNNSVNLEGQYYGRGQSQGYEKRFVPRQHLWNGSINPANPVNANNNYNIPQVSGYNNNLFGKVHFSFLLREAHILLG